MIDVFLQWKRLYVRVDLLKNTHNSSLYMPALSMTVYSYRYGVHNVWVCTFIYVCVHVNTLQTSSICKPFSWLDFPVCWQKFLSDSSLLSDNLKTFLDLNLWGTAYNGGWVTWSWAHSFSSTLILLSLSARLEGAVCVFSFSSVHWVGGHPAHASLGEHI